MTFWHLFALLLSSVLVATSAQGVFTCATNNVNAPAVCSVTDFSDTFAYWLYAYASAGNCTDCPAPAAVGGPGQNTSLIVGGVLDRFNLTGVTPSFTGSGPFCARSAISLLVGGTDGGQWDFYSFTGWVDSFANVILCNIWLGRAPQAGTTC